MNEIWLGNKKMEEKKSVTAKIAKYIKKNIQNGKWQVGEKISSENEVCKELGVSRVSVRNTLQQFIALGILKSVHGKGTFLISNDLSVFKAPDTIEEKTAESIENMKNILDFRCIVEPEVCRRVAETASQDLISEMERLLKVMQNSIGKKEEFVDADLNFHLEICRACDNPIVLSMMMNIFNTRLELGYSINLVSGYYGGLYYHGLLLDAFKKHDGKKAKALMLEHLKHGIDDLYADNDDILNNDENSDIGEFDNFSQISK